MPTLPPDQNSPGRTAMAWTVHAITASGAVLAVLALGAVIEEDWNEALLWLLAALAVDGVDGTLARRFHVKTRAARIDGATLDLVVDYLTYVFIPTIFIWRAGLVPEQLAPWLAAAIQLSSLYAFARSDMKTDDNYFRGFPGLWNIVALYLYVAALSPTTGTIIVGAFVLLSFAPVHFVHPFRVRDYGIFLPLLSVFWAFATLALLWQGWDESMRGILLIASAGSGLILVALGLLRTFRGPRPAAAQ
jgi:phosphatidylcholine synthase